MLKGIRSFRLLRCCCSKFLQNYVFLSLIIVFISANSTDPDEMLPYMGFHLGLHYLFANSLDPDQARQYVGPGLGLNCLTLMVYMKQFFKKVDFAYGLGYYSCLFELCRIFSLLGKG